MISAAILACAVGLHLPIPIDRVIRVESGEDPIAINVNGVGRRYPTNRSEAAEIARRFMAAGYSVDLGLTQINSGNLGMLGLTVEQALEPCANVRGGATILAADWQAAKGRFGAGDAAMAAALSAYNTGSFQRGFANGYVAKYAQASTDAFRQFVADHATLGRASPRSAENGHDPPRYAALDPYTADTTIDLGLHVNAPFE